MRKVIDTDSPNYVGLKIILFRCDTSPYLDRRKNYILRFLPNCHTVNEHGMPTYLGPILTLPCTRPVSSQYSEVHKVLACQSVCSWGAFYTLPLLTPPTLLLSNFLEGADELIPDESQISLLLFFFVDLYRRAHLRLGNYVIFLFPLQGVCVEYLPRD